MPNIWKAFSLSSSSHSSSSSPSTSTTSPTDSPNTRRIYGGGRRLTRQRKLRHVSDDELRLWGLNIQSLIIDERSKSLPVSPEFYADFGSGSRSPHHLRHWSTSSPVPLPLPLPELNKQNLTVDSNLTVRVDSDISPPLARDTSDRTPAEVTSSQHPRSSTPTYRRRWFPQDLNAEGVEFRLNVPARSAPGSGFTSPVPSPKRFSTQDLFHPPFHQPSSPSDAQYSFQLSPTRVIYSADHSPLSSPTLPNPVNRTRNHRISAVHSHHKSLPESSLAWTEANNIDVHPLPLPPGVPRQPELCTIQSNMDKPCVSPTKGQWLKGKLLGRGTYGSVYEATNRETGALCAMKEVDLTPDDPKSAECIKQLEQEIRVLRQLKHRNIVQYYGSEIMEDRFCIYLEYVHPGSINKYVRDRCGAMTESIVRNFTRHIVSGLAYLHRTKTIHRDIKGANLLVDACGVVKLADFGLAKHLFSCATDLSLKGSPHWMAPEVMEAMLRKDTNPELAFAVDIWSLGCTVIEMFTGQPPWGEFNGVQAMFSVLHKSPPIPEKLSSEGKDFLRCCFRRKPEDRPSAMMLLEHVFLRNTVAGCSEDFSRLKSHDALQSPNDPTNHKKELKPLLPGTSARHGKSTYSSESCQQTHPETSEYGAASHHSPRSTLEVLPCISSLELNSSSPAASQPSIPSSLPLGRENRSPNRNIRRETPNFCIRS
ncbi:mitogen-activated protein kinase kinase kinase 5-like isoform X1 [Nicotiana tabacum]|uniref:mitogen-activated protein kinase kinase kinase n=1 Tax=Nicotiana tabacum TaxID=4097 RepID=A0A1S4AIS5_TOBAC|nr:PREDICTED: mitogen-activated protein kinase kinase kinase YODA-like isoform X1 [Nicotiana tabacum]